MLADASGLSYNWLYVMIGVGSLALGLWKRQQIGKILQRFGGVAATKEVVELFEKEVAELRTQRDEDREEKTRLVTRITELENRVEFLVAQLTGEAPIRQLAEKIDLYTQEVRKVLATVGGDHG